MTVQSSGQGLWVWVPRPAEPPVDNQQPIPTMESAPDTPAVAPIQSPTVPAPIPAPAGGVAVSPPAVIGNPPVTGQTLTEQAIANMTIAEINANWDTIAKMIDG